MANTFSWPVSTHEHDPRQAQTAVTCSERHNAQRYTKQEGLQLLFFGLVDGPALSFASLWCMRVVNIATCHDMQLLSSDIAGWTQEVSDSARSNMHLDAVWASHTILSFLIQLFKSLSMRPGLAQEAKCNGTVRVQQHQKENAWWHMSLGEQRPNRTKLMHLLTASRPTWKLELRRRSGNDVPCSADLARCSSETRRGSPKTAKLKAHSKGNNKTKATRK